MLSAIILLPACLPVNRQPYAQKKYYRKTTSAIQALPAGQLPADTVQAGWARVNITPHHQAPLAGYGKRKGKRLDGIHDSIYVRAFVFRNRHQKVAYVTMDLLIVPMSVRAALAKQLPALGLSLNQTYLTATHSHSSLGGWARKPAGYLMAGKYDKAIVAGITAAIVQAIGQAERQAQPARLGFASLDAGSFVYNRLLGDKGGLDKQLRLLKIQKQNGETALLCTFAAHATCLPAAHTHISGDYPGVLVQELEKLPGIDFAAFSAGAVASHGPAAPGEGLEKVAGMAKGLSQLIQARYQQLDLQVPTQLQALSVPLYLRAPHWRVSANWRLLPVFFDLVLGRYPTTLQVLQIGGLVFAGTPCDFSGELVPALEQQARRPGRHLVVTSFNGGYIGYVTPDAYYDLKKYETRDMNLFGPYNGAYLSEMLGLLLQKL
ncbi:MAG: neutral/alkaline non-lysosomal ceramidase N-terminal domain-containing protein [Adhaeribacter sp.]